MKRNRVAVLMAALSVGLLLPSAVLAHTVTMLGSLKIEGVTESDLTGKLVGFAVISNPGLEKTVTQHLPPFTLPVFVDGEKPDDDGDVTTHSGGRPFNHKRFETTVVLTNVSGAPLGIVLKLRDALGNPIGSQTHTLEADHTVLVHVSDLVP